MISLPVTIGVVASLAGSAVCAAMPRGVPGLVAAVLVAGTSYLASMALFQRGSIDEVLTLARQYRGHRTGLSRTVQERMRRAVTTAAGEPRRGTR